ncbi:hypothetical protein GTQ43_36040 [Nostoc sp. KVJ3]|uniref:Piwi domain-containing protein n=1 Tax=Nostoc sp. KVJ3 TaxID=457945 RepID=UPI002239098A|nr:Piwi domain-containing protein [Nostoc sp. KVJ3]MCW5318868.1 hypothetical protein [Nostoc sp. KVJ3]
MNNHIFNLFAIENLSELSCSYQLLEITNLPDTHKNYLENINRLAGMVASSVQKPVCVLWQEKKAYLATTAPVDKIKTEWRLVPHIAKLVPESKVHHLDYSNIAPDQVKLAIRLLNYDIRTVLMKVPEIWNDSFGSFYFRDAINSEDNSQVDALPGFVYRLHYLLDKKIYISLDSTIRYIDRLSLLQYLSNGSKINDYKFQHFLYKFGSQWYRIQLMGSTGNSLIEQLFFSEKDNKMCNVYDYTLSNCGLPLPDLIAQLDQDSTAINYQYPYKAIERYGAGALCFKTYKTNDFKNSNIHKYSILKASQRLHKSEEIIGRYFQNIFFGNSTKIVVTIQPLKKTIEKFDIPDLLFGNEQVLHVKRDSEDTGVDVLNYGKARMNLLLDEKAGLLVKERLEIQYIFIPKSLNRSVAKNFQNNFEYQMKKFLSHPYELKKIIYNDEKAKNLRQQVEAIKNGIEENEIDRGRVLLILPEKAHPDLHNFIKRELFEILQFQCINAVKLKDFFKPNNNEYDLIEKRKGKYYGYIKYAALGMLLVNRQWPFALKEPLYYDVYIGIDVLNNIAGFTYIYNAGENCYFRYHKSPQGEKLTERQISSILKKDLREDISSLKLQPSSIVIHRDGRSFTEEHKGFVKSINSLQKEGFLSENINIGVIEIHKTSSARLRLYYEQDEVIENPSIGDYFLIDNREGIICTTGFPFEFSGTANPLHIKIAYGDLDMRNVLSDIFALAQLGSWAAPDKAARYPATIKIGDTFLEPIASDSDDEAALYSEDEPDEEEISRNLGEDDEVET